MCDRAAVLYGLKWKKALSFASGLVFFKKIYEERLIFFKNVQALLYFLTNYFQGDVHKKATRR